MKFITNQTIPLFLLGGIFMGLILYTLRPLFLSNSTNMQDATGRIANEYGFPQEQVLALARLYELQPNEIRSFGPNPFPLNYFKDRIKAFEQQNGYPPPKGVVENFVKGYIAKCTPSPYTTDYIFYSDNVHPNFFNTEVAMVIRTGYQLPIWGQPEPDDPLLTDIWTTDLRDGSTNPSDNTYWQNCVAEYTAQ